MGAAKNRKAEIAQLKATVQKDLNILAIRHCKDGSLEFNAFRITSKDAAEINASHKKHQVTKNSLLNFICTKDWLHTPPVDLIYSYVQMSNTWAMRKQIPVSDDAVEIHFYESDRDQPWTYSCREIMLMSNDRFFARMAQVRDNGKKDPTMSVKENFVL